MSDYTTKENLALLETLAKGFTIRDTTAANTFAAAIPQLVAAVRERDTLAAQLATVNAELTTARELKAQLAAAIDEVKKLRAGDDCGGYWADSLHVQLQRMTQERDALRAQLATVNAAYQDLDDRHNRLRFAKQEMQRERDALRSRTSVKDGYVDRVVTKVALDTDPERDALRAELTDVLTERDAMQAIATQAGRERDKLVGEANESRDAMMAERNAYAAETIEIRERIAALEATAEDARTVCGWVVAQGDKQRSGYVADWSVIGLAARRVLGQLPPRSVVDNDRMAKLEALAEAVADSRAEDFDLPDCIGLKVEREDRREDKREMRDEIAKLRAVAEAARVLNATLKVEENGLWYTPVTDDGEECDEQPDVDTAMERMTAALAALDDKGAT